MNELESYRQDIDALDQELTLLFEKRLETVLKVGAYKKKHRLPLLDADREKKVIEKNIARLRNSDFQEEMTMFYKAIMNITKQTQKRLMEKEE
ncbi:chorismate mutase [Alkalibacterium sp. 20]|uniref:chorismate mutase n=1 Tax=Alkalibacterium sp. 20 TaxID=1798803 RepID=UPI00090006FE|nr:chorismate mutase [Alkalibacterium sp. 20]OJF97117.1 chorismate mutase [Alkalibacterium sp. 20]